ncbi:MAG: PepSY domain-containing protein [Clostridia bacterium]|nr:PepSY domain-containing protein [Clostridia bacterium]
MKKQDVEQTLRTAFAKITPEEWYGIEAGLSAAPTPRKEKIPMTPKSTPTERRKPSRIAYAAVAAAVLLLVVTGVFVTVTALRGGTETRPGAATAEATSMASAFVTEQTAIAAALADASAQENRDSMTEADVTNLTCKRETENGRDVYDVEFSTDVCRYDYDIDAADGHIVSVDTERIFPKTDYPQVAVPSPIPTQIVSMDEAKAIALKDAGIADAGATFTKAEIDADDGRTIYDLEFVAGGVEYDYEIDAQTGTVLSKEKESRTAPVPTPSPIPAQTVSMDDAKAIALKDAGVKASDATFTTAETDTDDGRSTYELEFIAGGVEYDYEIDPSTGAILSRETEQTGKAASNATAKPSEISGELIGSSKAKSIALSHAGVSASEARDLSCEQDKEDGKTVYEVDFKAGGYEYDYVIDAYTGKILSREKEKDD